MSLIVAILLLLLILRELWVGTVIVPIPFLIQILLPFQESAVDRETHPKWFWFFIGLQACLMIAFALYGAQPVD